MLVPEHQSLKTQLEIIVYYVLDFRLDGFHVMIFDKIQCYSKIQILLSSAFWKIPVEPSKK